MKTPFFHLKPLLLGTLVVVLVFIIEIYTLSVVGTGAYLFVVLCFLWFLRSSRFLIIFGLLSSLFIVLAFLLVYPQMEHNVAFVINRILSLAGVWLAVYFTIRFSKLNEEERTKTEQLNALFENANEGILFADVNGSVLLANPFLEKMFGYAPGELLHKNVNVLLPEKYAESHSQHLKGFVNKPEDRLIGRDLWARHKGGREFPVEVSLSHFHNKDQLFLIAFVLDATEKKKHQEIVEAHISSIKNSNLELEEKVKQRTRELERANLDLKKSEYLYKAMAHNFPDGIIGVLNKEMKYLLVDGMDLGALGFNEEVGMGNQLFEDIHSRITGYSDGAVKKVFNGESVSFDIELKGKIYNIVSVPIPGSRDEINEILLVVKNVTDQKKLEQDLIRNLEKEKELSLLKSRFVTLASHEFRSPLTTILSSAFLLEHYTGEQLERERKKHLDRIKRSVHGLTELLNDFLSLGRLEEGKIQAVYNEINLKEFMGDLIQEIRLLKKEEQKLHFVFEGNEILVMTDKHLLRNILLNLLSNAVKYSPASGNIELAVNTRSQQIMISVTDEGIGIPAEEQKHIFKRFFRAKNAAETQGTGLGLNIVKKYVKLLDGTISFTSILNQGTTFRVSFPLVSNQHKHLVKALEQ